MAILLGVFGMTASVMGDTLLPASITTLDFYNWSGYAIAPSSPVNDIQGNWTVPAVNSSVTPGGYSVSWIGIDGLFNGTVEQIGTYSLGTAAASSLGTPQYFTWFEMYPEPAYEIAGVNPGDSIHAEVEYVGVLSGSSNFYLNITDLTTGDEAYGDITAGDRSYCASGERVVQAPSSGSTILSLADFGSETFTSASASADDGTSGSITAFPSDQIYRMNLTPLSGLGAAPGDSNGAGDSFTDYVTGIPEPSSLALLGGGVVAGMVVGAGDFAGAELHVGAADEPA